MKGRFLKLISVITLIGFLSSGCASIVNGRMQDVGISSNPGGATAKVGGSIVTTPGTVTLKRNNNYTVLVEKEGYEPGSATLTRKLSGVLWVNALIGGVIGLGVDFMTGGAYKLVPDNVDVTLVKKTGS